MICMCVFSSSFSNLNSPWLEAFLLLLPIEAAVIGLARVDIDPDLEGLRLRTLNALYGRESWRINKEKLRVKQLFR